MAIHKRKRKGRDKAEQAFLEAYDPKEFERLSVAVDVVVLTAAAGSLFVVLVQRSEHPDLSRWAVPGGFVAPDERIEDAAQRVLQKKARLQGVFLEQLYTFGEPDRDPRMRIISVAYYALVHHQRLKASLINGDQTLARLSVPWEGEEGGPVFAESEEGDDLPLAFDHAEIIGTAVKRIRGKLDYVPIGFQLLPKRFTLRQLQDIHETVLDRTLNKHSFRRRMLASGLISATGELESDVEHRPAELYRFTKRSAV